MDRRLGYESDPADSGHHGDDMGMGKKSRASLTQGPDSGAGIVTLDPITWTVRIETDIKDQSGKPVHVIAEGKMEDIGNYHRTISGTWRQGTVNGNFKLTRDQ